jgi:ABC-2 type transport system ATP-binding protein
MKALEIKNLKKSFLSNFLIRRYRILKNINITAEKGEIYGFLGPNAAGKTTTIKCVLGLITPDSGECLVYGQSSGSINGRQIVGFLPEQPYFYDYLTAKELLHFTGMLFSLPRKHIKERVQELIELVGLKGREELKLRKYSKGMIQRIGLAQALIHDPEFLILDEPFSGLDPIGRKELRDIILSLKQEGKTIFFSSHILQDMELMVDKVGIIMAGEIVKEGKISELISHSVNYYEIVFTGIEKGRLTSSNLEFFQKENNYIARCRDFEEVNRGIENIIMNQGKIISVTPVKMTLEDIFLKEIKQ